MWAENFGILYYAHGHIRQIETTMNTRIQHCKKIKKQRIKAGIRKVRSNLAPESVGRCQVFKTPVLIRFDMDESTKTDASSWFLDLKGYIVGMFAPIPLADPFLHFAASESEPRASPIEPDASEPNIQETILTVSYSPIGFPVNQNF